MNFPVYDPYGVFEDNDGVNSADYCEFEYGMAKGWWNDWFEFGMTKGWYDGVIDPSMVGGSRRQSHGSQNSQRKKETKVRNITNDFK